MATTRKQMFLEKINDSSFSAPIPVTAEEKILDGIGGDVTTIVIDGTVGNFTINKTYAELVESVENKVPVSVYFAYLNVTAAQVTMYVDGNSNVKIIYYFFNHEEAPALSSTRVEVTVNTEDTLSYTMQTYLMSATIYNGN